MAGTLSWSASAGASSRSRRREAFLAGEAASSLEGERKARLTAVSQDVAPPFLPMSGDGQARAGWWGGCIIAGAGGVGRAPWLAGLGASFMRVGFMGIDGAGAGLREWAEECGPALWLSVALRGRCLGRRVGERCCRTAGFGGEAAGRARRTEAVVGGSRATRSPFPLSRTAAVPLPTAELAALWMC